MQVRWQLEGFSPCASNIQVVLLHSTKHRYTSDPSLLSQAINKGLFQTRRGSIWMISERISVDGAQYIVGAHNS